jgi:hypothetical protein
MWDDLDASPKGLDIIAVNGAGFLCLEPLTLWCSIHGGHLVKFIEKRRRLGGDMDFAAYGNFHPGEESGNVVRWQRPNGGGSSGLFTALIALELGYDRLVLAGIPIEGKRRLNYADGGPEIIEPEPSDAGFAIYRNGWLTNLDVIRGKVRSMSGWTQELLGAPTAEWLNE